MPETSKKGETKRQHYVPRFVLRNFSEDERNVGVLVLESGKIVPRGPLKTQAYEDYFYGADQILEKAFSEAEAEVAAILGDFSDERLNSLAHDSLSQVALFAHYQLFRTKAWVEQGNNMVTMLAQRLVRDAAAKNKLPLEFQLKYKDGAANAISMAAHSETVVRDLSIRFIRTRHSRKFVIGDHPVVLYNQFAEHHSFLRNWGSSTGLAAKGLMLVMPFSPNLGLLLFDSSTYEVDGTRRVCNVGPRDTMAINRMQAVNSWKSLFFDVRSTSNSVLEDLVAVRSHHPNVHHNCVRDEGALLDEGETGGELIRITRPDIRVGARLSFLRVKDRHNYCEHDNIAFPTRMPMSVLSQLREIQEQAIAEAVGKAKSAEQSP